MFDRGTFQRRLAAMAIATAVALLLAACATNAQSPASPEWDLDGDGACSQAEDTFAMVAVGTPCANAPTAWDRNGNGVCDREEDVVPPPGCTLLDSLHLHFRDMATGSFGCPLNITAAECMKRVRVAAAARAEYIPPGAAVAFVGACPPGWKPLPGTQGRFILGTPTTAHSPGIPLTRGDPIDPSAMREKGACPPGTERAWVSGRGDMSGGVVCAVPFENAYDNDRKTPIPTAYVSLCAV